MITQLTSQQTWEALEAAPEAVLIDVRTPQEWRETGLPDLAALGRQTQRLTWAPGHEAAFAQGLADAVPSPQTPVYFLCRSGVRSQNAALLAAHLGYARITNVADGFEGPPDGSGQRGHVAGWQAAGLPAMKP